jgi:hypothetical protein
MYDRPLQVNFKISPEEKAILQKLAHRKELSMSGLIRHTIADAARRAGLLPDRVDQAGQVRHAP